MQKWLFKILVCSVNVFILAYILPGIYIVDFFTAILVAIVLSLLDAFVKPLLVLFTLPATIVTLGLFLFVINAGIILLDAYFVHGFRVN
ncbi:MAG TPA: phage holin family protein, partial [Ferruginibacter sp.]|nr:phage holin family protein [Ferruginibacter sp.]HNN71871.1 phage holin family protein [Ferruginibacter sp.]